MGGTTDNMDGTDSTDNMGGAVKMYAASIVVLISVVLSMLF